MYNLAFIRMIFIAVTAFFLQTAVVCGAVENLRETPVVKVVRENAEAVVNISTERIVFLRENPAWGTYGNEFDYIFGEFFGLSRPRRALKLRSIGSGVIIDKKGIIVTNAHVVHMASTIYVILYDGTSVEGQVMYENPRYDLAIIKIDPPRPLKEVILGRADDIMIGETVVAIGNPLGLENSVSVGVISGKEREIYSSKGAAVFEGLVQTDAPINPGNSGGALLNLNGELIGINVAVVESSQSIGFAIPVNKVKESIEAHKRNEVITVKQKRRVPLSPPEPGLSQNQPATKGQEKWDALAEMDQFRKEMDQMFQDFFGGRKGQTRGGMFNTDIFYDSSFDLEETDKGYEIKLDISGLDKEKIDVEISEYSITVSGQSSGAIENRHPQGYYKSQRFHSFLRTIPLPADADPEGVTTEMKEDTLVISLPKKSG
jgi:S1-C subfamily serine protease/HSP20 family molecular chaperone IbpA